MTLTKTQLVQNFQRKNDSFNIVALCRSKNQCKPDQYKNRPHCYQSINESPSISIHKLPSRAIFGKSKRFSDGKLDKLIPGPGSYETTEQKSIKNMASSRNIALQNTLSEIKTFKIVGGHHREHELRKSMQIH